MRKVNPLIQWWMTPKLPKEHIFIPPEKRPKGFYKIIKVYFRKWLVHPIKRRMARYYVRVLQKIFDLTVIGITGSAGKTSTKDMTFSILKQKGKTVASYKNIDPVYNIPTTILKCRPWTKYLVLEMGVEFPGEMDYYLWLARPDIGVITNVYPTHTEFFGNVLGVVKEKAKLIQSLSKKGTAVLNIENLYLRKIAKVTKAKVVWYGAKSDISAENLSLDESLRNKYTLKIGLSKINIQIPLLGSQFVSNSLAAAAVGSICQVPIKSIKKGLKSFEAPEHRMRPIKLRSGCLILDDSYNNNPEAAKEALNTLKLVAQDKKKVVVMGDMLELGKLEKRYHKLIGKLIGTLGINYLIGVGFASKELVKEASKTMKKKSFWWVKDWREVLPILNSLLKKQTVVLIKGSRSIGLDNVIQELS
jgi:UDP-N-acetylmuramoyl-tripeptide--D-alanyl-D-alanine ligase